MSNISSRMAKVWADQFVLMVEEINHDTTISELQGDSLDQLELVMGVEDEFAIEIYDADWERLRESPVADWVRYVERRLM